MLERGGGLRDENDEAGVCSAREWKDLGDVGKGEERWFISLEEEEEDGRRGRRGADERWDRWWWVVRHETSSSLLLGSGGEGRGEWGSRRWCKRQRFGVAD
jgi:hypothetical protein